MHELSLNATCGREGHKSSPHRPELCPPASTTMPRWSENKAEPCEEEEEEEGAAEEGFPPLRADPYAKQQRRKPR